MAHTLGGVSFATTAGQNPFDGEVNYVREKRWSVGEPLGYTGRIRTEMGIDPLTHNLHCYLGSTTMAAIKALADAGVAVVWVYTDGDIGVTTQTVLIVRFSAKKNAAVKGATRWDCEIELEEQP